MQRLGFKIALVLTAVLIAVYAIYPPDKKLRKGKDLAGGVSLVYAVDLRADERAGDTLSKMIDVLKNRVDPTGTLEIAMVSQGNDRIEITMPLPSERVKKLRAAFEAELAKLTESGVTRDRVEAAMQKSQGDRASDIRALAAGDAERAALLESAGAAFDTMRTARAAFDAARPSLTAELDRTEAARRAAEAMPESDDRRAALEAAKAAEKSAADALDAAAAPAADAEAAYDAARDAVMSTVVSPVEVRKALELSKDDRKITVRGSKEVRTIPSPRSRAVDRIKSAHPGAAARLDGVIRSWENYQQERQTLDDPSDLIRILKGAGVLHFRIAPKPGAIADETRLREEFRRLGPRNAKGGDARWYKINKIDGWYNDVDQLEYLTSRPSEFFAGRGFVAEEFDGEYYILLYDVRGSRLTEADGDWSLARAFKTADQLGRPAIGFQMNAVGAARMGELTGAHVGEPMAILLDDQVYTAPTLNAKITSSGIIEGTFTESEVNYVIRVLSAGSLAAKLSPEPISTSVLAPDLGADNLRRGLHAGFLSFIAVSVFMVFYYYQSGLIAVFALILNALFLVGAMALQHAAFTLPGIAGVILTFGQAVDSNVLIYERMREEFHRGADMKTAVRLGFSRAFSPIMDGNISNLIICAVLYSVGTQEIKGFAVSLSIGVVTTLFTALVVSRLIFTVFVDHLHWRRTSQLPMTFPTLQRFLTPNIDWMKQRHILLGTLAIFLALSAVFVIRQGSALLGTEFSGGTAVTIQLREDPASGRPMQLTRQQVHDRLRQEAAAAESTVLRELENADIQVVNPEDDNITSSRFTIKTVVTDTVGVQNVVLKAFRDVIDSQPPVRFDRIESASRRDTPVYPVLSSVLGESIDRPDARNAVQDYVGGAAVVLAGIDPPTSVRSIESRIRQMRGQADFSSTLARHQRIVVLDGTEDAARTVVLLVRDDAISYFDDADRWYAELAAVEWSIVKAALTQTTTLAGVQSFSPSIARTFTAQAVVSVVLSLLLLTIYVWARFGTVRWAVAATVPLFADVVGIVGMVGLAEILCNSPATGSVARSLGLLPFKFDLAQIAAMLTIVGYSLNDKIVILDRIRENKGKLPYASYNVINDSINQTLSRTIITAGAHLITTMILYIYGGEAVRGFAFALNLGVILGTYTSIVSSPLVWSHKLDGTAARPAASISRPKE
ncbi:MAG: protein translocase subunit SecD [Phycisphaerae bacterium]|nr:protein translocase subunit SecD [Phycisphaerae bacterium]